MPDTDKQGLISNSNTEKAVLSSRKLSKKLVAISRIKRKLLKHVWIVRLFLIACLFLGFYLVFILTSSVLKKSDAGLYARAALDFFLTPEEKIRTTNGRTNILILGKGGEGHEAPDLTDTIIFASVYHNEPLLFLLSLPRDIWIPELRAKLNSAYYWGNQREEGGGLVLAKAVAEKIVGQPIHYGVVIDFSGFTKIIDEVGGVEVDVERGFVDEKYPIAGRENDTCNGDPNYSCRYETVTFEKGKQFMDGETALKFVRSRNAEGDEGTDLARAARQQKVIWALREKILSSYVLLSPRRILAIAKLFENYIETDIDPSAAAILARRVFQGRERINSHVLSEDLLINPPLSPQYDNLYVFIPKSGTWDEVNKWIEKLLITSQN